MNAGERPCTRPHEVPTDLESVWTSPCTAQTSTRRGPIDGLRCRRGRGTNHHQAQSRSSIRTVGLAVQGHVQVRRTQRHRQGPSRVVSDPRHLGHSRQGAGGNLHARLRGPSLRSQATPPRLHGKRGRRAQGGQRPGPCFCVVLFTLRVGPMPCGLGCPLIPHGQGPLRKVVAVWALPRANLYPALAPNWHPFREQSRILKVTVLRVSLRPRVSYTSPHS